MAEYEKTTRELRHMLRRQMLEDRHELMDYARDLVIELEALRKAAREVEKAAKDKWRVEGKETVEDFHRANEAFRQALDRLRRAAR